MTIPVKTGRSAPLSFFSHSLSKAGIISQLKNLVSQVALIQGAKIHCCVATNLSADWNIRRDDGKPASHRFH